MIKVKVEYTNKEQELVDNYVVRREGKLNEDWNNDEFSGIKKKIKNHYKATQNYTCPYCKVTYPVNHNMVWDIEHVIPRDSHTQFMFEPENLCVACKDCNGAKSSKNVLTGKPKVKLPRRSDAYKIVHPHFDRYKEHINAIAPGDFYRSLSPKGEFTIITCRLLRFYAVVDREQPDQEINEFAMAMVGSDGAARKALEDELVRRINLKRVQLVKQGDA